MPRIGLHRDRNIITVIARVRGAETRTRDDNHSIEIAACARSRRCNSTPAHHTPPPPRPRCITIGTQRRIAHGAGSAVECHSRRVRRNRRCKRLDIGGGRASALFRRMRAPVNPSERPVVKLRPFSPANQPRAHSDGATRSAARGNHRVADPVSEPVTRRSRTKRHDDRLHGAARCAKRDVGRDSGAQPRRHPRAKEKSTIDAQDTGVTTRAPAQTLHCCCGTSSIPT